MKGGGGAMGSMAHTVVEYERSCAALRGRVLELNGRISGRIPLRDGESVGVLEKRRYILYTELAEMEHAIFRMKDYLRPSPKA